MENDTLTEKIIGICFNVHNELGAGFVEKVYENALRIALKQAGFEVQQQVPVEVSFRGIVVGEFYADLVIDHSLIMELKATKKLLPEHQAQLINYLRASKIDKGLLVNFAATRLELKRSVSTL